MIEPRKSAPWPFRWFTSGPQSGPSHEPPKQSMWHREVMNTGSVARDNLANERTFLAWLRTGLSSIGLGIALAKFTEGTSSLIGGAMFIFVGMLLLYYTGWRYFVVEAALADGRFAVNQGGVCATLCLSAIVGIACLVFVGLSAFHVIT